LNLFSHLDNTPRFRPVPIPMLRVEKVILAEQSIPTICRLLETREEQRFELGLKL
jgi:hypothetical protein